MFRTSKLINGRGIGRIKFLLFKSVFLSLNKILLKFSNMNEGVSFIR